MALKMIIILLAIANLVSGKGVRKEREAVTDDGTSICYGDLGCFEKNGSLFGKPLFPSSPDKIDTQFRLYTQKNLTDAFQILSADDVVSFNSSYFDPGKLTKIVVHGFIENGFVDWIQTMKNELLKAGDFNVLVVDWGKGSRVGYDQAVANTRVVGAEIARLIKRLEETFGANPEDFHVIGHSLGAHISGYAGERLPNLGRITGLDPAGPQFENKDKIVRLDPTDAKFVDVIHTAGRRVAFLVVCGHNLAQVYFTESINSECPFKAYRCESYEDFKQGGCMPCSDVACGYMGFHADRAKPPAGTTNVKYFLDTGKSAPFCRHHYQITVMIGNLQKSATENGKIKMNLIGSKEELGEKALID
ncbi:hypothetical protein CHS0354_011082, partial [Potamilus streckersoni]